VNEARTVCQMSPTGSIPGDQKKYELVSDRQIIVAGTTLYRIRALKDFGNVKAGDLGGFVRSEDNSTTEELLKPYPRMPIFAPSLPEVVCVSVQRLQRATARSELEDRSTAIVRRAVVGHATAVVRSLVEIPIGVLNQPRVGY
jgi:hypothetical protein